MADNTDLTSGSSTNHTSSVNTNDPNDQGLVSSSIETGSKPRGRKPKSQIPCRFFGAPGGCRAGVACPFLHAVVVSGEQNGKGKEKVTPSHDNADIPAAARPARRKYQAGEVDASKVVSKPVPKNQPSKRDHEIQQVKRRFKAAETATVDGTILSFKLAPTDPDFPYELEALDCVLQVPKTYPESQPSLKIQNRDMERGFQINLENGFNSIVRSAKNGSLLSWLNALDRQLEALLSGKKADTIKLVLNRPAAQNNPANTPPMNIPVPVAKTIPQPVPRRQEPVYSSGQRQDAAAKRERDTRQLEARLGRQVMYAKSSDGIAYTLPIEPRKKSELPVALQSVKSVRLFVPMLYPLIPCRIALQGVPREAAQGVEQAFEAKSKEVHDSTLVSQINYLVTHMHLMAEEQKQEDDFVADMIGIEDLVLSEEEESSIPQAAPSFEIDDRRHIIHIPRPPEWQMVNHEDAEETSEESQDDSDDWHSEEEEESAPASTTASERGISIDFPGLEMHGMELLDIIGLSLSLRCARCKEINDIENLRSSDADDPTMRTGACRKCASEFSIAFHHQFLHSNSHRAGYMDLNNCTVADMLLSKFAPTCSNCSTTYADPVVAVRGDTPLAICRKCHTKMSFRISEVKFLLVSSTAKQLPLRKVKKPRENLGLSSGSPLPRHGRCKHYSKSLRWFRFGCCAKVYACDRCHDENESHPNEHANRMICGYCSREQRYRPEDCGICKALLVGKKQTGFWEGGQGTRDQNRMSRKDPRKYKRRGGNNPVGGK